MSDEVSLHSTIAYVREFCEQLALLLRTADTLMLKHGYEPAAGNLAITETSGNLGLPNRWFPNEVFRFYTSEAEPRILAFVAALLDDRNREYEGFTEPLLTAGGFLYAEPVGSLDNSKFWWARWHGFMPDRRDDGTVLRATTASAWPGEKYPFGDVLTFGVPLVHVQSSAVLGSKVIDPLVGALRTWNDTSRGAPSSPAPSS